LIRIAFSIGLIAMAVCAADAQWDLETSNTTADLRGIHSVGGGVAWASGTNGTVLRTEDGGFEWQTCTIPPGAEKLDFRGIQAFDANTAIVMSSGKGDLSRLYKTTDGCHSWKLVFTNPDKEGFWDAIYFDRKQWGWLLGDPVRGEFALFATDNGGRTWIRQHNKGIRAESTKQGAFAASNSSLFGRHGIVFVAFGSGGTGGAFIYMETGLAVCVDDCSPSELNLDGRKNQWVREPITLGNRTESSGIFSLGVGPDSPELPLGHLTFVAVGGDFLKPGDSASNSALSHDGGQTWSIVQTPPHGYRSAVAYDAAAKTWITVGPNGTDISTDDGRNWRAAHPDPALHEPPDADRNWNALSLPFVVGPHGRIGKLNPQALKP
jgi:hypothetical protein